MSSDGDFGTGVDAGLSTRCATEPEQRAALRYEASLLQMLRHPGVTELIRTIDADGVTELTTRSGSDETLTQWEDSQGGEVDTAVIAGVLAALATTCADLHGLGVVHGRIEPHRVAIPPSGQPVLTGFEAAGPIGSQRPQIDPPLPPFCDPAATPGRPLEPATDVFGLGALLEHLLARHPPTAADPARSARRRLRRLARSATAEAPDRRPDAAALAAAILDAAPAAHLPGRTALPPSSDPNVEAARLERPPVAPDVPGSRRGVRPLAIAGAAVLVGAGALLVLGRDRQAPSSETATVSLPADGVVTRMSATSARPTIEPDRSPAIAAPSTATTSVTPATGAPIPSKSGPPSSAPLADTALVVFDGVRYRIDGGERRWAIGDWDCDGGATLVTLDPSSGALTFFDRWPDAGSTQAVAADRVLGAVDLRAETVGECHELAIVRADRVETYEGTGDSR